MIKLSISTGSIQAAGKGHIKLEKLELELLLFNLMLESCRGNNLAETRKTAERREVL